MDGGRVLRAVLSGPLGRLRATEFAATVGRCLAIIGVVCAIVAQRWDVVVLGMFVYFAGSMELRQVRAEGRPPGTPDGFIDIPPPPAGFRWANGGDGVWRLVPIMVHVGGRDRSWN